MIPGVIFFAERSRSVSLTVLTVGNWFKHEIEILASPEPPTVGVT